MKLADSISIALSGLKANRTRSVLTTLGIIIGIAAVIGIMSIGESVQGLILGTIQGMGSGLIEIIPGNFRGLYRKGSLLRNSEKNLYVQKPYNMLK